MSQQTYKVVIDEYARQGWRDRIEEWLEERGRLDHLVSMYLIGHPLFPGMVVILKDRLTAIMLKLSWT